MKNTIAHSGNSDVDIRLNMDVAPIAYALGCLLHTTKKLSDQEFVHFVKNLKALSESNNADLPRLLSNSSLNRAITPSRNADVKILPSKKGKEPSFSKNDHNGAKLFLPK